MLFSKSALAAVLLALGAIVSAHPVNEASVVLKNNGLADPKAIEHNKPRSHHHSDSSSSSSSSSHDDVRLALDGGWYNFNFGKEGRYVDTEFTFYLHGPAVLKITDYFCSGDRFGIKDNGVWLGPTSWVPFDHCASNTTNPTAAYHSPAFSHAAFNMAPGSHRITIKVLVSPYHGGSAAIRLDSVFHKCPTLRHGLALVNTHVPFCDAKRVCECHDMDLADLDIFNFLDATDVAFQCAGAFSESWIHSWSENDYGHACLALSTGVSAPGGAINMLDCEKRLPVLCQARKQPCGWDKPCRRQHHGHHGGHRRGCGECKESDWDCWTSCDNDYDFDELECQPHMPCWPRWCAKHGTCDMAKQAIAKRQLVEQKKAQAGEAQKAAEQTKKAAEQKKPEQKKPEQKKPEQKKPEQKAVQQPAAPAKEQKQQAQPKKQQ